MQDPDLDRTARPAATVPTTTMTTAPVRTSAPPVSTRTATRIPLEGRVMDDNGKPLNGAQLQMEVNGSGGLTAVAGDASQGCADGTARVTTSDNGDGIYMATYKAGAIGGTVKITARVLNAATEPTASVNVTVK